MRSGSIHMSKLKKIKGMIWRAGKKVLAAIRLYYGKTEKTIIDKYNLIHARYDALDRKRQKRVVILAVSLIIIADYLMICFHTGRNPVDIFPSIPVLDLRDEVAVYLPSSQGTMLKEKRLIKIPDDREIFVKRLTQFVTNGSAYENTRAMSPIKGNIRKVWIHDGTCVIDMWLETLDEDAPIIQGSEQLYREAVKKTVMENIEGIHDVIILENGIPGKKIWETALQSGQTPEKTSTAGPVIHN
jgi:hypothetical protein